MPFSTYSELKTEIADWLNRSDLSAKTDEFISLAEARIRRKLRRFSTTETVTVSAGSTLTLPATCGELRSIRLDTGSPSLDYPIRIGTKEQADELRAWHNDTSGRPQRAFVVENVVTFAPTPDTAYSVEIVYFDKLVALSDAAPTNSVLTDAPDLYLYGALCEAAPYLRDDARVPMWNDRFRMALDELNEQRELEENNASLRPVRLPVVF